MADIKSPTAPASTAISSEPVFLREEEVRQGIELLFFAYRDFTAEPDAILEQYGFGRAHQRVVELTERGRELERQLSELQRIRVAGAYRKAGPQAVEGFRKVLLGIIAGDDDRRRFDRRAARG